MRNPARCQKNLQCVDSSRENFPAVFFARAICARARARQRRQMRAWRAWPALPWRAGARRPDASGCIARAIPPSQAALSGAAKCAPRAPFSDVSDAPNGSVFKPRKCAAGQVPQRRFGAKKQAQKSASLTKFVGPRCACARCLRDPQSACATFKKNFGILRRRRFKALGFFHNSMRTRAFVRDAAIRLAASRAKIPRTSNARHAAFRNQRRAAIMAFTSRRKPP